MRRVLPYVLSVLAVGCGAADSESIDADADVSFLRAVARIALGDRRAVHERRARHRDAVGGLRRRPFDAVAATAAG